MIGTVAEVLSNLTVVVQGPVVADLTPAALRSIRRHLPGANIVLSTWAGQSIAGLDYDDVVQSADPGALPDCYYLHPDQLTKPNNINRQIVSTRAGLALVRTKFALKLRSDFTIESDALVRLFVDASRAFTARDPEYSIFDARVLTVGTGDVRKIKLAYHLGDLLQLGLTSDLIKLWAVPLVSVEDGRHCSREELRRAPYFFNFRLAGEQHLWIEALRHAGRRLEYPKVHDDLSRTMMTQSESAFVDNLLMIDYDMAGVSSKFGALADPANDFAYTFAKFARTYVARHGENESTRDFTAKYLGRRRWLGRHITHGIVRGVKRLVLGNRVSGALVRGLVGWASFRVLGRRPSNRIEVVGADGVICIVRKVRGFDIRMKGHKNVVRFNGVVPGGRNVIVVDGSHNLVEIGEKTHYIGKSRFYVGNGYRGRTLKIGADAMIMGAKILVEEDFGRVIIGDHLTCSEEVLIQNSDGHVITDGPSGVVRNAALARGIVLGDHVWIGRRVAILKNVGIGAGSVVASGAVVTKSFAENRVVLGGNPARVIKTDVFWSRDRFNQYLPDLLSE